MPTPKEKIIEEFDKKFNPYEGFHFENVKNLCKDFLSTSLDSYLDEVMNCLPKKNDVMANDYNVLRIEGFNTAIDQFLDNLRNNNLIK